MTKFKCIFQNDDYINAYLKNKDLYEPIDKMCLIKIELNKLSMSLINAIKNRFSLMYNKLIDFAFEVNSYEITPPAVWAVMRFLKLKNITVNYDEVISHIENCDNVLEKILNYLHKFDNTISIYKINIEDNLKTPSISIINNPQMGILNFIILLDIEKNEVVYEGQTYDAKSGIKK